MTNYTEKMDELRTGKLAELLIKADEFTAFRETWLNYSQRKEIVGEALRNGDIIYRYVGNGEN